MKTNIIKEKSFGFAVETVNLYKSLLADKHEYVISRQFVRSGTSIGACIREGINAESKLDFIHKLGIAQKECDETIYWIELMYATEFINHDQMNNIKNKADEIMRILRSIIVTAKNNLHSKS